MRRAICFLLGAALVSAGAWWGYEQLFLYATPRATMAAGAAFLIFMGGYLLWFAFFGSRKQ